MAFDKVDFGPLVAPIDEPVMIKGTFSALRGCEDRVELSGGAKMLFVEAKTGKIGAIRAKIRNGFYDSPLVTEKVVEALLRDLHLNFHP